MMHKAEEIMRALGTTSREVEIEYWKGWLDIVAPGWSVNPVKLKSMNISFFRKLHMRGLPPSYVHSLYDRGLD